MKLNIKTFARIYSTDQIAEVTITEMVGNNKYLAEYKGRTCAAMFNPFMGTFFVDDVEGSAPEQAGHATDDVHYELNYLSDCSQRELEAYRSIGSVEHFKRLNDEEVRRTKRSRMFKRTSLALILSSGVAGCLYVFVTGIMSIIA